MKTYSYDGRRIPWTNTTGSSVASGTVIILATGASGFIGISLDTIAAGASGELEVCEAQTLNKNSGEAFTPGQLLYWNSATAGANGTKLTGASTGNTRAGRSDGAYASSATSATLLLNQA